MGHETTQKENVMQGPPFIYLDTEQGAREAAREIHEGWVVVHYGATYGTAFSAANRENVARVRRETANPPVTVSIVATYDTAKQWIDYSRLHPSIVDLVENDGLRIFEQICFVLFPGNDKATNHLSTYCVNPHKDIQVFFTGKQDPILHWLQKDYDQDHYLVRSSNTEGKREGFGIHQAFLYAQEIEAKALVLPNPEYINLEHPRQRIMTQPIIELPQQDTNGVIRLRRAGNTDPETMKRLCAEFINQGLNFTYEEVKQTSFDRQTYTSPADLINPSDIRQDLMRASALS